MVLTKDITSRVLQRNLSELILLANHAKPLYLNQFQTSVCTLETPDSIEIIEAVTELLSLDSNNITKDGFIVAVRAKY